MASLPWFRAGTGSKFFYPNLDRFYYFRKLGLIDSISKRTSYISFSSAMLERQDNTINQSLKIISPAKISLNWIALSIKVSRGK